MKTIDKENIRITELVERFFEGETTQKEERELYAFFSTKTVPEDLQQYQSVFQYFAGDLEKELQIVPKKQTSIHRKSKKRVAYIVSVAASVLIIVSVGLNFLFPDKNNSVTNPYEGSYIIRDGVKITDMKIVLPEIEATLQCMLEYERELDAIYREFDVDWDDDWDQVKIYISN